MNTLVDTAVHTLVDTADHTLVDTVDHTLVDTITTNFESSPQPKSKKKSISNYKNTSFKGTLVPKKKTVQKEKEGLHIIEGETKSQYPSEKNNINVKLSADCVNIGLCCQD